MSVKFESEKAKHPEGKAIFVISLANIFYIFIILSGFWKRDHLFASMKNLDDIDGGNQEEENIEEDVDGLACTAMTIQTIDPFTKREFSDPVKSTRCNHSYERATIEELIKTKPRGYRCYHMGCKALIMHEDLVSDEELKRHIVRIQARAGGVATQADQNAEFVF